MDVQDQQLDQSRRDFVKTAFAAGVFAGAPFRAPPQGQKRKIIIIGAGIAGISAARTLMQNSDFDVEILEARSRIGGRIHTIQTSNGKVLELGANWIHDPVGNPIVSLCKKLGLTTSVSDNWTDIQRFSARGLFSDQETKEMNDLFADQVSKLLSIRMSSDQSLGSVIQENILGHLDEDQTTQFLHMCRTNIEDEYGASLDQISFQTWKQETQFERKQKNPNSDLIINEGYGRLVELLAQNLNISLNVQVKKISIENGGVRISDGTREWVAEQVVVTVPLGVLKSRKIEFSPPLPDRHQQLIDRIGFGRFEKVIVTVPTRFWPSNKTWLEYFSNSTERVASFFNHDRNSGSQTLIGLATGALAKIWPQLSKQDLLQKTLGALNPLTSSPVQALDFKATAWCEDPFTLGSYSFPAVGQKITDRRALTEPVSGRLHFAGEATDTEEYGTVSGAYTSGLSVGNRIRESRP